MTDISTEEPTLKAAEGALLLEAECADCGLLYSEETWADIIIPDDVWLKISPSGDGYGLLCFNCMHKRLYNLGLINVPLDIASGPFAFHIRDTKQAISG